MSFRIEIDTRKEWCDICNVNNGADESTPARPFIRLWAKSREGQHVILAHVDCLERKIAKEKKKGTI